jgi:PBP1b-binding outer membrane lipoprotein LpoB
MRLLATVAAAALLISGCASTPEQRATKRFDDCMDATLPSFGPLKIATADQRIKAAEVCKGVMSQGPAVQGATGKP